MPKDPNFYYFLVAEIKDKSLQMKYLDFFQTIFRTQKETLNVQVQLGTGKEGLVLYSICAATPIDPLNMNLFTEWMLKADGVKFIQSLTNCSDVDFVELPGVKPPIYLPGYLIAGYLRCKSSLMDLFQTSQFEIVVAKLDELLRSIEVKGDRILLQIPDPKRKTIRFLLDTNTPISESNRIKLMEILEHKSIEDLVLFEN